MSSDYVYISAAPEDLDKADAILSRLREIGCDVRANPCVFGDDAWAETTQTLIEGCRVFLPIVTPSYIESLPCRREVNLADACHKTMMTVFWEETPLKYGMALQLSTEQGIEKYKHPTDEGFFSALIRAECLASLRGATTDTVSVGYFARCVLFAVTCGRVSPPLLTERFSMPEKKAKRICEAMVRYGYATPPNNEGESRMLLSVEGFELLYLAKRGLYAADEVVHGLQ